MNDQTLVQTFKKKIYFMNPKTGKLDMRIQTWILSPDEDEEDPPWEYVKDIPKYPQEESAQTDPSPDTERTVPFVGAGMKRKAGRPKGSKNKVKRKTQARKRL